jgi:RNA polymerase sporulation-specific sigma factor
MNAFTAEISPVHVSRHSHRFPVFAPRVIVEEIFREFSPRIEKLSTLYCGGNYHTRQDLFQEGALGLLYAVERFDFTRGTKLATFANAYIRGRMQNFLRAESKHRGTLSLQDKSWRVETEEEIQDDTPPLGAAESFAAVDDFLFQVELRLIQQPLRFLRDGFTVKQRRVFTLRFGDGMNPSEIAALLRVSPARVSQMLAEAIARLRRTFVPV